MTKSLQVLLALVVAAVASLLSTGTAQAAPYWQTYAKTSAWHCEQIGITPFAITEACVIVNGNSTQAAVILTNRTVNFIDIRSNPDVANPLLVQRDDSINLTNNSCYASALGGTLTRACMGRTVSVPCGVRVRAWASANHRPQGAYWFPAASNYSKPWHMCT
jgi:hypothetical protein